MEDTLKSPYGGLRKGVKGGKGWICVAAMFWRSMGPLLLLTWNDMKGNGITTKRWFSMYLSIVSCHLCALCCCMTSVPPPFFFWNDHKVAPSSTSLCYFWLLGLWNHLVQSSSAQWRSTLNWVRFVGLASCVLVHWPHWIFWNWRRLLVDFSIS